MGSKEEHAQLPQNQRRHRAPNPRATTDHARCQPALFEEPLRGQGHVHGRPEPDGRAGGRALNDEDLHEGRAEGGAEHEGPGEEAAEDNHALECGMSEEGRSKGL